MGLLKNIAIYSFGMALAMPSPVSAGDMTLTKFPKEYTISGTTFYQLEGYWVDIPDHRELDIYTDTLRAEALSCYQIHSSFMDNRVSARKRCLEEGVAYTCSSLYNIDDRYRPTSRGADLVPFVPIQKYADYYSKKFSGKRVIAINTNFFNTKAFPNRSTDDSKWKPIFQEACGVNLGTFREVWPVENQYASAWRGRYSNVETGGSGAFGTGTADKPFGTLRFDSPTGSWKASDSNLDDTIDGDALGLSGAWIRINKTERTKSSTILPAFVRANWDAKVGRTAIGFQGGSSKMKVVVIQPGAADAKTKGVTVPQLLKFFPADQFTSVLMLDGGGSSSLAANFVHETTNKVTSPARDLGDCIFMTIKTCTARGNYVGNDFVSHWSPEYRTSSGITGTALVDRWIPNALILVDKSTSP